MNENGIAGRHTLLAVTSRFWVSLIYIGYRLVGRRCFLEWDGVVWQVIED